MQTPKHSEQKNFILKKSFSAEKLLTDSFKKEKEKLSAKKSKENKTMKDTMTQQGRETLEKFKMEAANEVGVNLKNGYNGDLTAREVGSVGGQMVNMMTPEQQWCFTRNNVRKMGHSQEFVFVVQSGV